jgi:hypothetical protein
MDWCEKHLQRGLKVVGTREVGPDEWECEDCFRGLRIKTSAAGRKPAESKGAILDALDKWHEKAAAKAAAEIKEKTMASRKIINPEQVRELYAEGFNDSEIAQKLGFSDVSVGKIRRDLNLPSRGKRGQKKGSRKSHRSAAMVAVKTHIIQEGKSELLQPGPEIDVAKANSNGHAKARVVMFEIEGGDSTILAAIETVKAALAR